MLYYLLFWTILGFIFLFYIIFGTNLLTGGPAQNCCFFAYFSVSKKRNIKRSRNGMKSFGEVIFGRKATRETWSPRQGSFEEAMRRRGHAHPPGRALHPRGPLVVPLTYFFRLYISIYPKTIGEQNRSGVPPPQASVATKNPIGTLFRHPARGGNPHRWPSSSSRRSP